jgi:hypothetical protein
MADSANVNFGCVGCLGSILLAIIIAMLLGWMDPPSWLVDALRR